MNASGFGCSELLVNLPLTGTWTQISINYINVTNGQCTFGFYSNAGAGQWCKIDEIGRASCREILYIWVVGV
jgi:hypothetical protein